MYHRNREHEKLVFHGWIFWEVDDQMKSPSGGVRLVLILKTVSKTSQVTMFILDYSGLGTIR